MGYDRSGRVRVTRPGIVLSLVAHAAFLFWLAYMLAFSAPMRTPDERETPPVILLPPPPPPPTRETKLPPFVPAVTPPIMAVDTSVRTLEFPPDVLIRRPQAPPPVESSPVVMQPRVISRTNPEYPEHALENDKQGYVDIEGTVASDGSFRDGRVTTEIPEGYGFAGALLRVIPKWRFEPKTVDGKPVPYRIRYRFSFALAR